MAEVKKLSLQALLKMAEGWKKEGKVASAIKTYETVIGNDPEGEEAEEAEKALLGIAQDYENEGKKDSAFHLYKKVAFAKYSNV